MSGRTFETYEQACEIVKEWGMLPLSGGIPGHPSLGSVTGPASWHTGTEKDPWLWRARFSAEGIAAYGRFIEDRTMLVDKDIFPMLRAALRSPETMEERLAAGRLSEFAVRLYDLIRDNPGIDVRLLRKTAGMQEKAHKKPFDRALIALQNSADLVISGIYERLNDQGHKNGWNSTCYMLSENWMERHETAPFELSPQEAWEALCSRFKHRWESAAVQYLSRKIEKHWSEIGV